MEDINKISSNQAITIPQNAPLPLPQPPIQQMMPQAIAPVIQHQNTGLPIPVNLQPTRVPSATQSIPQQSAMVTFQLDKNEENIKNDKSLVPFNPQEDSPPGFDLAAILKNFQEDNDDEDMMVQATQSAESSTSETTAVVTKSSSALIRKNNNTTQVPSFSNCKIANININIYK